MSGTKILGVALIVSIVPLGCGGDVGSSCRSTSDCSGDLECSGPSEPQVCGIGPQEGCMTDADCGTGMVCHAIADGCSPDGVGARCDAPCTTDPSCGTGFRCGAGGACETVPCDEGYVCADHLQCDPSIPHGTGPVHARTQGCVIVTCTSDSACATGAACVNGWCQSGPGTCVEVRVVP